MALSTTELSDAFELATRESGNFKLCPNRVWGVAGKSLPKLIPTNNPTRAGDDSDELRNHNICTFDFCEYSQRDFTAVDQRHECRDKNCDPLKGLFSRQILENAARADESTVWTLDGGSMISRPQPYMAISHVWSDGTGAGQWPNGEVNKCLYDFFKRIAVQFQCDGIWWDTLCIPQEKAARTKAVKKIQTNYESARITLVHDCFLRNWMWDPDTACFAILMSPWFSRGWTALELQRSRKVKVVFNGPDGLVIKDLDEDILAKEGDGPRMEASKKIKSLRKEIKELNDLLTILGPRSTSWPKDISVISGLLAEVKLSSGPLEEIWQQDIYKRILIKMGKISFEHLFHNSATMSTVGWCPTSLYDMPMADDVKASLKVTEDLDIEGRWKCIPLTSLKPDIKIHYNWKGTHPLIKQQLENYLQNRDACSFLFEDQSESATMPGQRAILGKKREPRYNTPCYEFLGAIYFQPAFPKAELDRVCIDTVTLLGDASEAKSSQIHKIASQIGVGEQVQSKNSLPQNSSGKDLHDAIWRGDPEWESILSAKVDNFNKSHDPNKMPPHLELDGLLQQPLHLAAERGDVKIVEKLLLTAAETPIKDTTNETTTDNPGEICAKRKCCVACKIGQTALHRASWGGSVQVVERLLDHGIDPNIKDKDGNTAIHIAAEKGFELNVRLLLKKSDCWSGNKNGVTPLHFAAWSGEESVIRMLHEKLALLKMRDFLGAKDKHGWTPLHYAASNGQASTVTWLLQQGAGVYANDGKVGWTPLHFAVINGHVAVIKQLVKASKETVFQADNFGWTPQLFAELKRHPEALEALSGKNNSIIEKDNCASHKDYNVFHNNDSFSDRDNSVPHKGDKIVMLRLWTELHCTAIDEQQVSPKQLLEKDVSSPYEQNGKSLRRAARQGLKAVVNSLLQQPEIRKLEEDCNKAMREATKNGHDAVVRLLIETFQANVESSDDGGQTALSWAAKNGHETVVRLLIELFKANIESTDNINRTALLWAARKGHGAIVKVLLEKGAELEVTDEHYQTSLLLAAKHRHEAVVKLLLEKGAELETRDEFGRTPLCWAVRKKHGAMEKLLLEKGANPENLVELSKGFHKEVMDIKRRHKKDFYKRRA